MNNPFAKIGNVPFDLSVLQTLFPDKKHITDKALCDLITFTPKLSFRFMSDIRLWLEEDMRFDMDALSKYDGPLLEEIAQESHKQQIINTLIKFMKHEKYI
jgi:hypothetical protein